MLTILVPARLLHHTTFHVLCLHRLIELRAVELVILLELLRDQPVMPDKFCLRGAAARFAIFAAALGGPLVKRLILVGVLLGLLLFLVIEAGLVLIIL